MRHREQGHQIALMNWARVARIRDIRVIDHLIHIPNEAKRSIAAGRIAKAMGLKPGVSDLFLAYPARTGAHGLWIEMKTPASPGVKAGKPTQEQLDWLTSRTEAGYMSVICYGWESAMNAITAYLEA